VQRRSRVQPASRRRPLTPVRIDLHIHSTASDGSLSPRAVVQAARSGGLDVIALADHDTIGGVAEALAAAEGSVHVIPALELSTHFEGAEVHVLGYSVDPASPILTSFGARASSRREERMRDMLDRLAGLGITVAYDDVLAAAETKPDSIGRPHLARAMMNHGHVRTVADAFDLYIGDEGPAFVPTRLVTPAEAITLIHDAGGVAVWAHPRLDTFVRDLPRMTAWGLDGVECYRPRNSPADVQLCVSHARRHGLHITGGSDWHGDWSGPLGSFFVGRHEVADLLTVCGI
jgi:3',5'-nucleoside bisphosphate phosphatase